MGVSSRLWQMKVIVFWTVNAIVGFDVQIFAFGSHYLNTTSGIPAACSLLLITCILKVVRVVNRLDP